jgi:hypothetical protein
MLDHVPPHRTGHRGFDWRWLAQSIRHFMRIREIKKNPFQWVPNMFALVGDDDTRSAGVAGRCRTRRPKSSPAS